MNLIISIFASFLVCFIRGAPVDVGLCNTQNITIVETSFPEKVEGVMWISDSVAFAWTTYWTVYRTGDGGHTWENQKTDHFGSSDVALPLSVSPHDYRKIMVCGGGPDFSFWTSEDAGETYTLHPLASNYSNNYGFSIIKYHPTNPDLILGGGWTKTFYTGSNSTVYFSIYITENFGNSWEFIDSYVYQFDWGSDSNVVYLTSETKEGDQLRLGWAQTLMSVDVFNMAKSVISRNVTAVFDSPHDHSLLYFEKVENPLNQDKSLWTSSQGGPWMQAIFPTNSSEISYSILDSVNGGVLVNVQHQMLDEIGYGDVYSGEAVGGKFVRTNRNNKKKASTGAWDEYSLADFGKMGSPLKGIYVANFYDDSQGSVQISASTPLKSFISYDMGGQWEAIKAPSVDSDGNNVTCTGNCSLHLMGLLELLWVHPGFYSVPGAVGIAIATGNIGDSLLDDAAFLNTYMTRDAGQNWIEVTKGSYVYEIGDLGSLIAFVSIQNLTNRLLYTLDEGSSVMSCQFRNSPVDVENLVVDPTFDKERFLMYGKKEDQTGFITLIDFSNYHTRTCQDPDHPGQTDSDYEYWSPFDSENGDCHLGVHSVYTRKKQDAQCFNPNNYTVYDASTSCLCTWDDYECDFCYEMVNDVCLLVCDVDPAARPDNCSDYYNKTQGYRLIFGNKCIYNDTDSMNLLPIRTLCSSAPAVTQPAKAEAALVITVIVVIFVGLAVIVSAIVAIIKYRKPAFLFEIFERKFKRHSRGESRGEYSTVSTDEGDSDVFTL